MKLLSVKLSTVILLLLSFSFNSIGADTYTLEYRLEKGKTYNQNLTSVSKMEVMGMNMGITSEIGIKYDVLGQNNDAFDIRTTYKRIKTNMSGPTSFVIDSDSPEKSTDKSIGEVFKSFIETPIDIQLTKQGKITSLKGADKLVEKINSVSNEQLKQLLNQQFSEKAIQASYEQMTILFPAKPVAIGESWYITKNLNSSGVDIISKMKLTLKQVKDNVATLDCTGTLATPEGGGVLSVQGMEAKVSIKGEQAGTILIDMKTGWIINSEITQKFVQDIEIMGQAMKQDVETKVTVTAE
jgi:hypothetical protein